LPIGRLFFSLGSFLKITKVAQMSGLLLSRAGSGLNTEGSGQAWAAFAGLKTLINKLASVGLL
jgi:hypothetical protein